MKKLEGVIIAMPTPLLPNEDIDTKSVCTLVDHCINQGANGIMLLGTMGEGVSLLDNQRQLLVETAVAHAAKRIPVLATVSSTSTRRGLMYAKAIEKTGIDYLVYTSSYYYKFPDPESLLKQLNTLSDTIDLPIIFYNAPAFTGNPVDVDTLDKILNFEKVVGIKDSSCNYGSFVELLRRYPNKKERPGTIMQGDESVFDASLLMGADGVISGGGVLFIQEVRALYEAAIAQNILGAMQLQQIFTKLLLNILMPNPQRNWVYNIKNQLANKGIIQYPTVTGPFLSNP